MTRPRVADAAKRRIIETVLRTQQPASVADVVRLTGGKVSDTWVQQVADDMGYPFPGRSDDPVAQLLELPDTLDLESFGVPEAAEVVNAVLTPAAVPADDQDNEEPEQQGWPRGLFNSNGDDRTVW